MKSPCSNCPFRKDCRKGWLSNIKEYINSDLFVCHKTSHGKLDERKQCAGHMILKGFKNTFVYLSEITGMALNLKGKDLVFDSEEECLNHHINR